MTPQTAAALRALEQKWRKESEDCEAKFSDSGIGWGGATHARHADELAAVLTQEGAECWRCFHCDETFTTDESAREHFGASLSQCAACQIDIAEYRRMEEKLQRYCEEDTELHREILRLNSAHGVALRQEEEKGYARGLRDARATAPAEPRAAEGAGTEIDLLESAADCRFIAAKQALRGIVTDSCLERMARLGDFLAQLCDSRYHTPTAAAAVPAGGGAWKENIEFAIDCLSRNIDACDPECTCEPCPSCGLQPKECSGTECASTCQCNHCDHCQAKDAIAGLRSLTAPAPRGGVTEAGLLQRLDAFAKAFSTCSVEMLASNAFRRECANTVRAAHAAISAPPAAQAQDAGPMARGK